MVYCFNIAGKVSFRYIQFDVIFENNLWRKKKKKEKEDWSNSEGQRF